MRVAVAALTAVVLAAGCSATRNTGPTAQAAIEGSGSVTGLRMMNATVGWAYGSLRLERTIDGALTFKDVTPPGVDADTRTADARRVIRSHEFLDGNRAWVLIGTIASNAKEDLERTSDGGATWTRLATILPDGGAALPEFIDERHGWLTEGQWLAGCSGCPPSGRETKLMRTTDGGTSWSVTYRATQHFASASPATVTLSGAPEMSFQPISDCGWWGPPPQFLSPETGFVGLSCPGTAAPSIGETNDGGRTWRQVHLPPPPVRQAPAMFTNVDRVRFFDMRHGVAYVSRCMGSGSSCTPSGAMLSTVDGGMHWTIGEGVQALGLGLLFADADHAWLPDASLAGATGPSLLITDDGGARWTAVSLPAALNFSDTGGRLLQLVTPTIGFAMVWTASAPDPEFFRTTDQGHTFEPFTPSFA